MTISQRVATVATGIFAACLLSGAGVPDAAIGAAHKFQILSIGQAADALRDSEAAADPALGGADAQAAVATAPTLPTIAPVDEPSQSGNGVPRADFADLNAAVAASDATDAIDADTSCIAGAVYFEAKGEPLDGQLAVAEVILNRARSGHFPASPCSVVTQPGQFAFVRGGRIPVVAGSAAYRTAVAVARVAVAATWSSPAPSAMYFHARRVAPGWHRTMIAAIGNHVFYR